MKHNEPDFTRGQRRGGDSRFWSQQLRARLGQDLRTIFEDSLEEPLPERISRVLGQMEGGTDSGRRNAAPEP